ncbi:2-dehydropantoate 2-reductase [Dyadobacter jejuensis]|uniref:2-dehydropantoate 2-reductase n=1 Tax=Dyadobacter jejuensis TaxID=1082580 RepID=A0A316B4G7_9BACT|nr:2-dehydropantoate 2-reductase [Dyadobacter jejuensis]PWJ57497.1 2-dehydropantoate 2-reductase [Dyadobacter jejuensis]
MKIGILGMGGVGCFIGAKLTKHYENDGSTQIIFICRNETKEAILNNGLTLIKDGQTTISRPYMASDDAGQIGLLDILLVTTKSFSLPTALEEYRACLKEDTVVIPIQNGVNSKSLIEAHSGHDPSRILEGCIYIVSNMLSPGVVKHLGGPGKIFFGNRGIGDFSRIEKILTDGGLDITYTKDITTIVWRKYLFVSPLAAMTTALKKTFGELVEDPSNRAQLEAMMQEVKSVAIGMNVPLTNENVERSLAMLSNFPYPSKSSLQLDFENRSPSNEKDVLVDFVIEQGRKLGINVSNYEEMNDKIAYHSGSLNG